jgi:hypothetical protein
MAFCSQPNAPAFYFTDSIFCDPLSRRLYGLLIRFGWFVEEKNLSLESDTCFLDVNVSTGPYID